MFRIVLTLAYLTSFPLVVAIVDTKSFNAPDFERVQHAKPCPKGTVWHESSKACLPK